MNKRLTKSADRIIAGVCGGIADYFEIDPTLVRACYAVLTCLSFAFSGVVLYAVLCFIMPQGEGDL